MPKRVSVQIKSIVGKQAAWKGAKPLKLLNSLQVRELWQTPQIQNIV